MSRMKFEGADDGEAAAAFSPASLGRDGFIPFDLIASEAVKGRATSIPEFVTRGSSLWGIRSGTQ